jgi:aryl-alcohol dehydrogenase-like predicted oxidoreductase
MFSDWASPDSYVVLSGREKARERLRMLQDFSQLRVPLGIGTMMWGNTPLDHWVAGKLLSDDLLREIVSAAVSGGVQFFDTAEGYGGGTSETQLAKSVQSATAATDSGSANLLLVSKYLPTLWRWSKDSFLRALEGTNQRLGVRCSSVYFIHSPIHPLPIEVWVQAASVAIAQGKMRSLGLSNFNASQVRRAVAEARRLGNVPIVANQIMFNLMVSKSKEVQETFAACKEHGIHIVAYSPLGQGLLCDGLTAGKAKNTRLLRMTGLTFDDLTVLREEIASIAEARGKKMSDVALNYVVCKGAVPLVGCRSVAHVHAALEGVVGWSLTPVEVARLDRVALGRHTFEKPRWRRSLFIVFISALVLSYRASTVLQRLWGSLKLFCRV